MLNVFLFLSFVFFFTFLVGKLVEKFRIPWILSSLICGILLAVYNPFLSVTSESVFPLLAQFGMYFLLFIIGLEIDLKEMTKKSRFIFKATFFIIFLEALFGTLLVHFIFHYDLSISFLVALAFATVGEAVLVPILEEFKAINTKLGQAILSIGLLDDVIEVFALILAASVIGTAVSTHFNTFVIIGSLVLLFALTIFMRYLGEEGIRFNFISIQTVFLFVLAIFFFYVGIGEFGESAALAAFLAGIGLKTFIPPKRLEAIGNEVKTMCYGFFAPLFFVWAGLSIKMNYLFTYPALVLLVVLVSGGAKILGSYIVGRNYLGSKQSILLGIGLSVRFSTSIIIIKLLYDAQLVASDIYSVIVASSAIFVFIIPPMFAALLARTPLNK
ncbi:MAG: cation:proton antiporter [Candidatus Diapherotrites archaeon]|nr:cation:proton antiporter [Candidatus Diapherotrites archaeon]